MTMTQSANFDRPPPDPFTQLRSEMVAKQLERRGLSDPRVLDAMGQTPRELFIPAELRSQAYDDCALPIDCGQTISQPFTVAFMLEALELNGSENVLEIGTGSGYNAALLSHLVRQVHTVERCEPLASEAAARLQALGRNNVQVHCGDGTLGLPQDAPFDAIIVTAGARHLPLAYEQQLAEGGRIIIPIGPRGQQIMTRFKKVQGRLQRDTLGPFAFVPLIGADGWKED